MIYVNGDSHCAGAEIINDFAFAEDDSRFTALGRRPHPENIPYTFGSKIASALNQPFFLDAESASSNDRILRTTKQAIADTKNKKDMFIIIGWSTFERVEWPYLDGYLQLTASGTDSVPEEFVDKYKTWVSKQTEKELDKKTKLWHDKIYDFHLELRKENIKHLFFNTYLYFDVIEEQKDWHGQYLTPYSSDEVYYYWLRRQGYQTRNKGYHYGADAHNAFSIFLLDKIRKQYNIKTGLTDMPKRSIVNKVKKY